MTSWYVEEDLWGRFHVKSPNAPIVHSGDIAGVITMGDPRNFNHTLAVTGDGAVARLVASTANYRSGSVAEWLELRGCRDQVSDQCWRSQLEDFGSKGRITDDDLNEIVKVCTVDGRDISNEFDFIRNVREQADRLLVETSSELFVVCEASDGTDFTVAREELGQLTPHLPARGMEHGEIVDHDGTPLAHSLIEVGRLERVGFRDKNHRHVYSANLVKRPHHRRVTVDLPLHVADRLGPDPARTIIGMME